jgi:hypothetical protein
MPGSPRYDRGFDQTAVGHEQIVRLLDHVIARMDDE